jgi:hypothetical protein
MEGKGVYRYQHGDSYEGSFLNSAPYGEGKYQNADGGFYQGEYRNLIHLNKYKGVEGAHRLPKCDGWRHGFGVVRDYLVVVEYMIEACFSSFIDYFLISYIFSVLSVLNYASVCGRRDLGTRGSGWRTRCTAPEC